ncbi:mitochondrial carrier [Aspergillus phoenicis ATCC 13157]|uniref:Mitochondrial carrier n=1 Tax=Aspergillus phoenicis ATCC 13157 TaxID=1353007 RepID=A0A370PGU6_ASPPH|nr:mitochondrial carrier [Aspergillus phoenicis ATCC 13157]
MRTFAGAASGIACSIVTCPLDVVKTRLQAQGGFRKPSHSRMASTNRGILDVSRAVWLEKGPRGMYQGLGLTVLGYIPRWAIFFSIYHRCYEMFHDYFDFKSQSVTSLMSSLTAGTCSIVTTNPIQVVRARLISQSGVSSQAYSRPLWQYSSAYDAARQIYCNEGIPAFYSGLTPALMGVSHLAIQFPLYEALKRKLTGSGLGEYDRKPSHNLLGVLAAGSMSKIISTASTYPHEVIRTRLQTQQRLKSTIIASRGIQEIVYNIWKTEGWKAFYAGLGASMIRAVPASVTTMLVYENMLSVLISIKADGERKLADQSCTP